jgi:hypothetical protein
MIRVIVAIALVLSISAGVYWKMVWLEPNPVIVQRGSSISYDATEESAN